MMRHRAILTGTFQRATYYNKPLPRMKVQPLHVSGMIQKRTVARQRRQEQHWTLMSLTKHMELEARFERALERHATRFGQSFTTVFQHVDWCEYICPLFTSPDVAVTVGLIGAEFPLLLRQEPRSRGGEAPRKLPARGGSATHSIH